MTDNVEIHITSKRFTLPGGRSLVIEYDAAPENPRAWNNFGTVITDNRHPIGDYQATTCGAPAVISRVLSNDAVTEKDKEEDAYLVRAMNRSTIAGRRATDKVAIILPIYVYEHGGMVLRTSPFADPWDSGQLGIIFVTHARLRKQFREEGAEVLLTASRIAWAKKVLTNEVAILSAYLNGEVFGYRVVQPDGTIEDSCWGFYGTDSLRSIPDHLAADDHRYLISQYAAFSQPKRRPNEVSQQLTL